MRIRLHSQERQGPLYAYHFVEDGKPIPPAVCHVIEDEPREPLGAVKGVSSVEDAYGPGCSAYRWLAWRLSDGLERFVIPTWHRDDAAARMNLPAELVKWEHSVTYWCGDSQTGEEGGPFDNGFVAARNPEWEDMPQRLRDHLREAGLFPVETLALLTAAAPRGECGETNLFCLRPGRHADLLAFLRTETRPD